MSGHYNHWNYGTDPDSEQSLIIGPGAFAFNTELTGTVTLPYITGSIGANAFRNNYLLEEFRIGTPPPEDPDYHLYAVGDKAFAYNSNLLYNDVGDPKILNRVGASKFGSGVFVGSGKMEQYVVRKETVGLDDDGDPIISYILVHAGRMGGAGSIIFNNGELLLGDLGNEQIAEFEDEDGIIKDVQVDKIDGYAFSYSDTVYYIKIAGNVAVGINAFYLIGEQLQWIDLTLAIVSLVDAQTINGLGEYAFAFMPRCPLYVYVDTYIPGGKRNFSEVLPAGSGNWRSVPEGTGSHERKANGLTEWETKFPDLLTYDENRVKTSSWFIALPIPS
jgi:hypothetical protein